MPLVFYEQHAGHATPVFCALRWQPVQACLDYKIATYCASVVNITSHYSLSVRSTDTNKAGLFYLIVLPSSLYYASD